MATKKLLELAESTSPGDSDILMIEDTVATKRITFLNLFNKVKAKLALATVATSGKASDLSGLATVATSGKLADTTKDANNRTITDAERAKWNGYGTDITSLNSNLNAANFNLVNSTYYPVTNVIVSGRSVQIHCAGLLLKDVPANAELTIGTLSEAYRPPFGILKYVLCSNSTNRLLRLLIDTDGKVTYTLTADTAKGVGVNINETFVAKTK
ncbi:hypothetical protein MCI89_14410 [Muricomes sp. OA1]|uniref:hypothetical protein n=1 Tax=Muricomes sp. OA1 TaxID=2914165 RepID=UPI001F05CD56|nr:hypothetical protein [Muricomes sp. OA1]MCH1973536.1 hypothetical protein [Muricomes sp. OA1]